MKALFDWADAVGPRNDVLGRAVAAAERDERHAREANWALSNYSSRALWKDATREQTEMICRRHKKEQQDG
jgi:hypothetical protein